MPLSIASTRTAAFGTLLSAITLFTIAGCGGGSSDTPETTKGDSTTASTSSKSASSEPTNSESEPQSNAGPKTIDGIPYDVFFDRPLEVAADARTGGTAPALAATQPTETPETTTDAASDTEPEPASADVSWSELITAELINEEVRALRNEMQSRLTNMGAYRRSVLELPVFGSAIAFFGELGSRHDGDIPWKENANHIRVLGAKIAEITSSSTAQNRNSYEEVNDAYLTINEILNNNTPAELPEIEEETPSFATFADMFYLMKRMERGQQWMQTNAGSESGFNDKAPTLSREIAAMIVLTQAYYEEDYGYADDEEFLGYLNTLRDSGLGMQKALEEKDFGKYDELRSTANQQCTQCHSVFKNG